MDDKAILLASEKNNVFVLPRQKYVRRRKFGAILLWFVSIIFFCVLAFVFFNGYKTRDIKIIFLKDGGFGKLSISKLKESENIFVYKITDISDDDDGDDSSSGKTIEQASCTIVPDNEKFDCYPDTPVTEDKCVARGCCWKVVQNGAANVNLTFPPLNVPYCYYPANYTGYNVTFVKNTKWEIEARLRRLIPSGFPNDVENVLVKVSMEHHSLRIQIIDPSKKRYEVPLEKIFQRKLFRRDESLIDMLYDVELNKNGDLKVKRIKTNETIFHTDLKRLVFSDQFLQLSSRLPSPYVYGLGQHKAPLQRNVSWQRFTFFNRDRSPTPNMNLYGSHPFYLCLDSGKWSHGVFLLNSNAMDVILQPTPAVTFRSIGGILDFFVFLGPYPDSVIMQFTKVIGTTFMPPYWSLGFHLCRYGYNTLNRTKQIWKQNRDAKIPFDVQWNDIDYMVRHNDFTYDKTRFAGLPEFVDELHSVGMHYIPIIDPGISGSEKPGTYPPYDDGVKMDIFVKNSSGEIFIGKVWNSVSTVFPDFTNPKAIDYWTKQFQYYHDQVKFDGAWIDMNEPSNFYNGQKDGCPTSRFENPPYVPGGMEPLCTRTLCMTCQQNASIHYNVHNLYGFYEAIATNKALKTIRKKRPFIISRSTFSGSGYFTGNWDGDIFSNWDNMRWTISSILNYNMFGIPMVGADICGFNGNTTKELCARWSALGAFYPFSRNHNTDDAIDQDPVSMGPEVVSAAKKALTIRYYLLPYLYTLFFKSHLHGFTVARPLFFEYLHDINTYGIDTQFLWGKSLMIIPTLESNVSTVTAYIPNDTWFDFYTYKRLNSGVNNTFDAPIDKINLALRGGGVIPTQIPNVTTTASRLNPFGLLVILDVVGAEGELFWDDGDSLDSVEQKQYTHVAFYSYNNYLTTRTILHGYANMPVLNNITVINCEFKPSSVTVNGKSITFDYEVDRKVLYLDNLNLNFTQNNYIHWK
ncbi:lysosomal alpha-glucosidase-like [Centruroides sculpturatus]|uniref:lysosomal alpha-glucosidase-like n=1 Tax=Centruroides sculpturatus TaxID=218467 RepID=UPI000C6D4A39|nr:lysosomal alpha-glucosidase-like [Centruroides sculpturatus]